MNKQQLAAKIWKSANKMRSKIEASEYKDYILGFIFYKYLSAKEIEFLKENSFTDEYISKMDEEQVETVKFCRKNLGYFIAYKNLYSTWLTDDDFDVSNVTTALSAFSRLIDENHKKVFSNIFKTLETGISSLGDANKSPSKAIKELLELIKDIPMDDKQGYDVLGFIYEYLISNFAANAGKKAGEFYTPHEVSVLMSEIISNHLKDKNEIKIYDPTSGSGSLLINIGKSLSKYLENKNGIKYFAQELKEPTYNLTRMNLVMRGIKADNIVVRNADTLEDDWPYFDDNDKENTYEVYKLDAVVSNPPYSQPWNPKNKELDPRYKEYGMAPKGKADYAFLLHDLYHLNTDGIMTIVLPHGVLFRGNEELEIRKNLIEKDKIDCIIGLPANIFFGTGIPTIIMVLKHKRPTNDVQIIDASMCYTKDGKNNKLRDCDIKRILDAVIKREDIPNFSKVISKEDIRKNNYNLNIPRYIDNSPKEELWDLYSTMFGGIPNYEIDLLEKYWKCFPNLKNSLYCPINEDYSSLSVENVGEFLSDYPDILRFKSLYNEKFDKLGDFLKKLLITDINEDSITKKEMQITDKIMELSDGIDLIDKYNIYQIYKDNWETISIDLEMIRQEGLDTCKVVDPKYVIKKKGDKEEEVQDGWIGHIIPFELVQENYLNHLLVPLKEKEKRISEISDSYSEIIENMDEEECDFSVLNDDNNAFVMKEVKNKFKDVLSNIENDEIRILNDYIMLLDNKEKSNIKKDFINSHNTVKWDNMETSKDGTYSKKEVNNYINKIKNNFEFEENSFESILSNVIVLNEEENLLKKEIKECNNELIKETINKINSLTNDEINDMLVKKWIIPITSGIMELPNKGIDELEEKIVHQKMKYESTLKEVNSNIESLESDISFMLNSLTGDDYDMKGIKELSKLLSGENDE